MSANSITSDEMSDLCELVDSYREANGANDHCAPLDKPSAAFEIILAIVRAHGEIAPDVLVATAWSIAEAHMIRVRQYEAGASAEKTDAPS